MVISRILGYNWQLVVPRVQDPEVALEPFIEWAIENVLLMGGKIGTHMLIRALSLDSTVRLWS
jgi:hypothetical protein